jgi:hypothetical protein
MKQCSTCLVWKSHRKRQGKNNSISLLQWGQESIICMHILVWLGDMKSWVIAMHDQLGGSPSNEMLLPIVQYQQFGKWLTFFI